jgi:hypothetical protein
LLTSQRLQHPAGQGELQTIRQLYHNALIAMAPQHTHHLNFFPKERMVPVMNLGWRRIMSSM